MKETVLKHLERSGVDTVGVLAVRRGDEALELNAVMDRAGELVPLTLRDEEGRRIYERSVRFVMLLALRRLYPGQQVRFEFSVGGGVLVRLPGRQLMEREVKEIESEMRRIVEDDLPFERALWTLDEAIGYFERDGQAD